MVNPPFVSLLNSSANGLSGSQIASKVSAVITGGLILNASIPDKKLVVVSACIPSGSI